jgi:hypothetical protein
VNSLEGRRRISLTSVLLWTYIQSLYQFPQNTTRIVLLQKMQTFAPASRSYRHKWQVFTSTVSGYRR